MCGCCVAMWLNQIKGRQVLREDRGEDNGDGLGLQNSRGILKTMMVKEAKQVPRTHDGRT